jgi:hypothetical protein
MGFAAAKSYTFDSSASSIRRRAMTLSAPTAVIYYAPAREKFHNNKVFAWLLRLAKEAK